MRALSWIFCLVGALLLSLGSGCKKRTGAKTDPKVNATIKSKSGPSVPSRPRPCKAGPLGEQAKKLLGAWTIDAEPVVKENKEWNQLRGEKRAKVLKELAQMTLTITPKWIELKGPKKTERSCWEARRETGKTVHLRMTEANGKQESLVVTWLGPDSIRCQNADRRFYFQRKR